MSPSDYKRLKLEIMKKSVDRIEFRLSGLIGDSILLSRTTREIRHETVRSIKDKWFNSLNNAANSFLYKFIGETKRVLNETSLGELNSFKKIREIIHKDTGWKEALKQARDSYMMTIGKSIVKISSNILHLLLPEKNDQFWRVFEEQIEIPTTKALQRIDGDKNAWMGIPLLQIRIDEDLLGLPWWLSRTCDLKSLWCCRYALAVSPHGETSPPKMKFSDLRILTITRATYDLEAFPLKRDIIKLLESLINTSPLKWRLMDGVFGDLSQSEASSSVLNDAPSKEDFQGVSSDLVRDLLDIPSESPNFIYYHGHSKLESDEQGFSQPHLYFHDDSIISPDIDFKTLLVDYESFYGLLAGSPLLEIMPPSLCRDSILIMNTCGSAINCNQSEYIQKYINEKSLFIGSNYSLLDDPDGSSANNFLENILRNREQFIAHCLLYAQLYNGISHPINNSQLCEIYKKASLCLFGDVRANLILKFDDEFKDNVIPIKLLITDRWKLGFEQLGISHSRNLSFLVVGEEEHPPSYNFVLSDGQVKIALAPLSVAIDLCIVDPANYIILGSAFSSSGSVGLVSQKIVDWNKLKEKIETYYQSRKTFYIGILKERLTSTFMVLAVFYNKLNQFFGKEKVDKIFRDVVKLKSVKLETGKPKFLDSSFLNEVDITLVLDEEIEAVKARGLHILSEDVETEAARVLGISGGIIPRGVFLTRKNWFRKPDDKPAIIEFCNNFNIKVGEFKQQGKKIEIASKKDIPLYTYNKNDPSELKAIKTIAESGFFGSNISFDWTNFAFKLSISKAKAERIILDIGNNINFDDYPSRDKDDEGRKLKNLQSRCLAELNTKSEWDPVDIRIMIKSFLQQSDIQEKNKTLIYSSLLEVEKSSEIKEVETNG